jgi:hypothetical protein
MVCKLTLSLLCTVLRFVPAKPFKASDWGISSPLQSIFPGAPTITIINSMDLGPSPLADNFSQTQTYNLNVVQFAFKCCF